MVSNFNPSNIVVNQAKTPFTYLLLKLAARCNLKCTYCYWFRDESVLTKPKLLDPHVEAAMMTKLERHFEDFKIRSFEILFHGGEPLLFGKARFESLCANLRALEARTGTKISLSMTSNGVLIDSEWAKLLARFDVKVTLSIDGDQKTHDRNRVSIGGSGSFSKVKAALLMLRECGIEPGVLAVCDPGTDPVEVCEAFVRDLGVTYFDILVPDATHDEIPVSIADYYIRLFNYLFKFEDSAARPRVRYVENLIKGLVGFSSRSESIGFGPISTLTMLTDGSLEPLDVLRIIGNGSTQTSKNILTHEIQSVADDPVWLAALEASVNLPAECLACPYLKPCGGGFLPHRFSRAKGLNNPSVYCADHKQIFSHIWRTLRQDLELEVPA